MSGSRPGGLTALAVLNFVFGGLAALGLLAVYALLGMAADAGADVTPPGSGLVYFALAVGTINTILLIASGVGYIGQKKFLGRTLGNIYGAIALIYVAIQILALGQKFGVGTTIGLIYPVLTLALLNSSFKDDFVNP